jgi:hypothetical protein
MRRRLSIFAVALSLVFCPSMLFLWARSYRATDWLMFKPDDWPSDSVRTTTLRTIRGGVQIEDYRLSWTGDHRYLKEIPGWFWGIGEPARDIRATQRGSLSRLGSAISDSCCTVSNARSRRQMTRFW